MKTADASLVSVFCKHKDTSSSSSDESEDLGDILDSEVNLYLNNKNEAHYKKIIWEQINKDYLQEQALKKQGLGAAAVVKKSKKRQRKKETPINKPAPADTESTREMLTKKRLSSKVNFDVLDELFSDAPESGSNKKQKASSCEKNNSSFGSSHCRNQLEEGSLEQNDSNVAFEEDVDTEFEDPTETYGNEYYDCENEEEYGYGYGDYGADEEY